MAGRRRCTMIGAIYFDSMTGQFKLWPLNKPLILAIKYQMFTTMMRKASRAVDIEDVVVKGVSYSNWLDILAGIKEQERLTDLSNCENGMHIDFLEKTGRYTDLEISGARESMARNEHEESQQNNTLRYSNRYSSRSR